MTELSDRHEAAKAALREHYETCPHGCKPTHSRCATEAALWKAEEDAWHAAHLEIITAPPDRRRLVNGIWQLIEDEPRAVAVGGGGEG